MVHIMRYLVGVMLCFTLVACTFLQNNPQSNKKAMCKALNYRIINNGATGNRLLATQQGAETATLTRSYHEEGC
jgi:hypothetical protein